MPDAADVNALVDQWFNHKIATGPIAYHIPAYNQARAAMGDLHARINALYGVTAAEPAKAAPPSPPPAPAAPAPAQEAAPTVSAATNAAEPAAPAQAAPEPAPEPVKATPAPGAAA